MFHVWFGRVSGGVDVFLALSGFFFGGRLLRTALTPGTSLWPVPEVSRLVRRLLPALVVVLAASAVLTILIQPETRWETFADQSLASLGYFQNWELANTASDYLRAGEAVSPLQHIWSMSVQGQFYIAFLALIFSFAHLFRRRLGNHMRISFVMLLSSLTIASFVYAIFAHNTDQATAYYNSFARAWELLLGALLGALVPYVRWPMWLRTTVAVIALAAILSCGALIDGVKEFPGPWALVPVGATMLFILSAANRQAEPVAGHRAVRVARGDGVLAVPVALAAADLLAVIHRPAARQFPRGRDRAAALGRAGVAHPQLRREPAAVPRHGEGAKSHPRRPAARATASPDDHPRLDSRPAGCGVDSNVVHLARARHRAARERQRAGSTFDSRLPRRRCADQWREGAQAADAPDGAGGQGRSAGDYH
jgi:hypothetical protein